jgi:hypothetical protein
MSLNKPTSVILLLIWCLFMGVTAISIGFGAAFPALNSIAQPFVCSNGHMQLLTSTSQPQPGVTYTAEQWQCVDNQTGQAHDVDGSMFLINGLIYGTLLFAIIMIWWWMITKRRARRAQQRADADTPTTSYTSSVKAPSVPYAQSESFEDIELQELKRMLDEGQLSNAEYWRKLSKILEHTGNQPTAETSVDDPIVEDLRKLKKMLDEGLITEADYEQKKAAILSRM